MTERGQGVVLIGFMGAGKTTVGRALARLTAWPLYETDDVIAARFGMSAADFFVARGEEQFRQAETEALATMPSCRAIIATGGGIVLRPENIPVLENLGRVIYLATDEETLFTRISQCKERRPLLEAGDLRAAVARVFQARQPIYRAAANHTVDTTRLNPTEAAQEIVRYVG